MAKTINLLPKQLQKEMHYDALLHSLWVVVTLSIISFALVFLVQFSVRFYLQLQGQSIHSQIEALQAQVNQQQNTGLKSQITTANNLISDYHNLVVGTPQWSKIILAFAPLTPAGVKINSLNIIPSNKSIIISGLAPNRDLVIALYNSILQDSKDFYGIDYPLENVALPTNDPFHFTFFIQTSLWMP